MTQSATVTQCPKFGWCVMGHAHKGQCSSAHYTLTEVVEPKVEAGNRALETARSVDETYMAQGSTLNPSDGRIEYVAALIQSAMNAQDEATETRWQNAIYELCKKMVGPKNDHLIDGGGCDSGDALDFTLAEIGQAIGFWQIAADAMNAQEREPKSLWLWPIEEIKSAMRQFQSAHPGKMPSEVEAERLLAERGEGI